MPSKVTLVVLAALQAGLLASAHMTIFHPSMYGWPPKWEDTSSWPTGYDPVSPLGPNWDIDDWWFRGTAVQNMPPDAGVYAELPAGGTITLQIACNIAWTTYGYDYTNVACPGNTGAYHSGTPGDDVEQALLSGCALAIADVDDISLVTWDNLVIFSVQQECVWQVNTTFTIPAAMPACTGDHCICGWFWLANNGTGNSYMTGFNCQVTRDGPNAEPAQTIGPVSDPAWCPDDFHDCQAGAKRPIYFYQNEVDVEWTDNYHRPGYHNSWGWFDGPQNDIFNPAPTVPTPAVKLATTNLALTSTVTASSHADGQPASAAVDGVIKGYTAYTGDTYDANEWSSDSEQEGAWLRLTFAQPQWVARVILYDRPNMEDRIHAATVTFSDGTTEQVGYVPNDASFGAYLDLSAPVYTKFVHVTVTAVSGTTSSVGLAEVQVYGPASTTGLTTPVNLASGGTATASSYATGSKPAAAIDGLFGGYTDDSGDTYDAQEWSSDGEGKGAWLKIALSSAQTVNRVVLSDRPNSDDQVTGATLSFSDGSTVTVGTLPNDGASLAVSFAAKTVSWVKMTVLGVSSTTTNVGLSEMQLFNVQSAAVTALSTSKDTRTSPTQPVWQTGNAQSPTTTPVGQTTTTPKTTTTKSTTMTTPKPTTTTQAPNLVSILSSILNPQAKATTTTAAAKTTAAPAVVVGANQAALSKSKSLSLSRSKSASLYSAQHKKATTTKKAAKAVHTTTKKTTAKKVASKKKVNKKVAKVKSIALKIAASKKKAASKAKARSAALSKGKRKSSEKKKVHSKRALPTPQPGHKRFGRAVGVAEPALAAADAAVEKRAEPEAQVEKREAREWELEGFEPVEMSPFDLSGRDMLNPFAVIPEDEVEGGPREEEDRRRANKRERRTSAARE